MPVRSPREASTWPKTRPQLTAIQQVTLEDWYQTFLGELLPGRYGRIERFNHTYAARSAHAGDRTLEIGPGNGSHLEFEKLEECREYVALELRPALSDSIGSAHPHLVVTVGDCQERLDYPDDYFDRVLAIHVLEHLENLPKALAEIARVLRPGGRFTVVIPCEGGKAYALGRRLTVARQFRKRYHMPYQWMIDYEHVNTAREVLLELDRHFTVSNREFFPLRVPLVDTNLIIGLTLQAR